MLQPASHRTMNPGIVADGKSRLYRSKESLARSQQLREAIRKRHAAGLAAAGFFRRLVLRWRIAAEFRSERRKISPSPQSLYGSHCYADSPE